MRLRCKRSWLPIALLGAMAGHCVAQTPAPPSNVSASDHPWDDGSAIDLNWTLSPDDQMLESYQIQRAIALIDGRPVQDEFQHVEFVDPGSTRFTVQDLRASMDFYDVSDVFGGQLNLADLKAGGQKHFDVGYRFRVIAIGPDGKSLPIDTASAVTPAMEWFDGGRFWLAVITIVVCGSVVTFIMVARSGRPLKIRKIAGLQAVDEAVGRATEMGRPILFVPGSQDMNDIQTVAGITVLARVARTAAEYDARVEVPTSRSLVMTAARETVQSAFLSAGRPDAYKDDSIYYVTDEQFGYCAYLQGMMVRDKPAACFYMGTFFAESLILAESGNSVGAIQIAGTAEPSQLPFFVAACDYTLIGEEFFAASAYLSGERDQLGSLKGQDVGKLLVAGFLIVGCIAATLAAITDNESLEQLVEYIRGTMLT